MQLPADFKHTMCTQLGPEGAERLFQGLEQEPSVSVRVNPCKADGAPLAQQPQCTSVPWCRDGYYLSQRPPFTFDPLLHAGAYYVQEASSMFVQRALHTYVQQPVIALDLCAAPGGKSTLMRASLPQGSLVVSNEPIRNRAQVLAENMIKWGHPDVVVTQNYPDAFSTFHRLFDVVVADVPCSGEGMFRKDEVAINEWSSANVQMCAQRQREIMEAVWPTLKPGGLLVYSTCTFNVEEDEKNVLWIARTLGAEVLPVEVDADWGICGNMLTPTEACSEGGTEGDASLPMYHFMPGYTRGEGFFMAVLRKNVADEAEYEDEYAACDKPRKEKRKKGAPSGGKAPAAVVPKECRSWVLDADNYTFYIDEAGLCRAFSSTYEPVLARLRERLTVLHAGVEVAECKGRDWVPAHGLAMSLAFRREPFPSCAVDASLAVAYLRKEAVVLDADVPKGIVCLTYKGLPLGFVKNLGNRANNLYPQEWRIRTTHIAHFCLWDD